MPRISDEHRAQRRRQILQAAMTSFGETGLHSTSMADVITESAMSAGAVYLYFSSKEDLIAAVADEVFGQVIRRFDDLDAAEEPLGPAALLEALLTGLTAQEMAPPVRFLPLLLAVWSESTRSDPIRHLARRRLSEVRGRFTTLLQRWADTGEVLPHPAEDLAPVLMALVQGFVIQHAIGVAPAVQEYLATVRAVLPGGPTTPSAPRD